MNPIRYSTSPAPWVPGALLYRDDCLKVLRALPADSISAITTDPPYGLSDVSSADTVQAITAWASGDRERVPDGRGFMGHEWDRFVPPPAVWDECLRVLKPGGYAAVFAGTRTADLMGLSLRLAGWTMKDTVTWLYSSGMPKGLNVGKAIDKAAGAVRTKIVGTGWHKMTPGGHGITTNTYNELYQIGDAAIGTPVYAPATKEARQWEGWNTHLKPAGEPILIAQKPFKGTIVNNVLKHGVGAMNIDACRVPVTDRENYEGKCASVVGLDSNRHDVVYGKRSGVREDSASPIGRYPSNVVLSHGEDCDETDCIGGCVVVELKEDSRFYPTFRYQAKAPKSERPVVDNKAYPTVKPLALMSWLLTLLTPPYGVVLDPFAGTGTTGQAALRLGFNSILMENNPEAWPLIDKRFGDEGCALYPIAG